MIFQLIPRHQPSRFWSFASPLLALLLTVVIGMVLFAALGKDPLQGLQMFFVEPDAKGNFVREKIFIQPEEFKFMENLIAKVYEKIKNQP